MESKNEGREEGREGGREGAHKLKDIENRWLTARGEGLGVEEMGKLFFCLFLYVIFLV